MTDVGELFVRDPTRKALIVIEITRSLARQLRAVFKKAVKRSPSVRPTVTFSAGPDGLRVRLHASPMAVEFKDDDARPPGEAVLFLDTLADFEGRGADPVVLEPGEPGKIVARWQDGGVPQVREYEQGHTDGLPPFPDFPIGVTSQDLRLLKALADASKCAAKDRIRYALDCVQLRGGKGDVVGTDGRQLLLQTGFRFGWDDALLVPASPVYGCIELRLNSDVAIGRTDNHVVVRSGLWTLFLEIQKDVRYPPVEHALPALNGVVTRCRIDPADAVFVTKALPRLPVDKDDHAPVTLDLNGQVVVRGGRRSQGPPTELVLSRSSVDGRAVRVALNRDLFARALALGLSEAVVTNDGTPVVFRDERRTYLAMPLDKALVLPPSADAIRVSSPEVASDAAHITPTEEPAQNPTAQTTRSKPVKSSATHAPPRNDVPTALPEPASAPEKGPAVGITSVIEEAEALRTSLRDAFTRSNRLVAAVKRQRRQTQELRNTLAGLRNLRDLAA